MLLVLERLVASMKCRMEAMACERTVTEEWDVNCLMTSSQRLLYACESVRMDIGGKRKRDRQLSFSSRDIGPSS